MGERGDIIEGLEVLAAFNMSAGEAILGAELIGAAEAERARTEITPHPDERPLLDATTRELQERLGRQAFEQARDRGARTSLETAVALALDSTIRQSVPASEKRRAESERARTRHQQ